MGGGLDVSKGESRPHSWNEPSSLYGVDGFCGAPSAHVLCELLRLAVL